jgi:ADP-ribosylation factor related protein 1
MYTLINGLYKQYSAKDHYFITIIGLDNAGKTTFLETVKFIYSQTPKTTLVAPTVGLNSNTCILSNYIVGKIPFDNKTCINFWYFLALTLFRDLGGQQQLQSIWEKYYQEAHGIIFVVDSTDKERIEAVRDTLEKVLTNDQLGTFFFELKKDPGLPILMLANKQDVPDALSVEEIQTIFNKIAESLDARDSKVLPISALKATGIKEAIEWIGLRMKRNIENKPPQVS